MGSAVAGVLGGIWLAGLVWFAASLPRAAGAPESTPTATMTRTDAIVVLTGGSDRLPAGFELLRAGEGRKLFISGVYRGVEVRELLALSRQAPGDLECCIALGYAADDTEGNAAETAVWMRAQGFRSLRLVTANYHMPRSLVEFRRALPEATIIPHPVAPRSVRLEGWWRWPGTASLIADEYNKFLLAWARARFAGPPDLDQDPDPRAPELQAGRPVSAAGP